MTSLLQTRHVFVAILALGLFTMAARGMTDPDVWWHLRTGQLILQNHSLFHTDPYSFTRFGQPWINHEWLSEVLLFGIYRLAGFGGSHRGLRRRHRGHFSSGFCAFSRADLTSPR